MGSFLSVAPSSDEAPMGFMVVIQRRRQVAGSVVLVGGHHVRLGRHLAEARSRHGRNEAGHVQSGVARCWARCVPWLGPLKAKVNLIGVIPSCENMPFGPRLKPATWSPPCPVRPSRSPRMPKCRSLCDALTRRALLQAKAVVDIATPDRRSADCSWVTTIRACMPTTTRWALRCSR